MSGDRMWGDYRIRAYVAGARMPGDYTAVEWRRTRAGVDAAVDRCATWRVARKRVLALEVQGPRDEVYWLTWDGSDFVRTREPSWPLREAT